MNQTRAREGCRHREGGLSLVELLVAVTVLAIATIISLQVYSGANRSFKLGENESEQQQATRIAFDILTTDIRMAGFNTNPDGNKNRPDEQIEAAYATALVIRADFDAGDPAAAAVPETSLAGDAFLAVSTGNDEIRAYVLAQGGPGGRSGPDVLTFDADVDPPKRDGIVRTVAIDNVVLTQDGSPYTLYRVSLDDAGDPVFTVLIENVSSLLFRYYDRAGNEVIANGGADLPPRQKELRGAIRRVHVEIEVLTRDPDLAYIDPADPDPRTRHLRKFRLSGDVTPRNLGMAGMRDQRADTVEPGTPAAPTAYPGHCQGLFISWPPNDPVDEVTFYRIHYNRTSPPGPVSQRSTDLTYYYLGGLKHGKEYAVAIEAVDAAGNRSPLSPGDVATTTNTNTPVAPLNLAVGQPAEANRVGLSWDPVFENTGATSGDIESPVLRELGGYRVYREESSGFAPSPSDRIADEDDIGVRPDPSYTDAEVVNCRDYYYVVTAVDECGGNGAPSESPFSAEISGRSETTIAPERATSVQAFFDPGGVRVEWDPVARDVAGGEIYIEEYEIHRTGLIPSNSFPTSFSYAATVRSGILYYVDNLSWTSPPGAIPAGRSVWYKVRAADDCNDNDAALSTQARPTCSFVGRVEIEEPEFGESIDDSQDVDIDLVGDTGNPADYPQARIEFVNETAGGSNTVVLGAGTSWSYRWDPQPPSYQNGRYRINVEVDQDVGGSICTSRKSTLVEVDVN